MCLDLKRSDKIKFTWFKPIVVYKIVYSDSNELYTLYRKKKVKIGRRYFSILFRWNDEVTRGLHSFVNVNQAFMFKSRNEIIVECVIPRFTWYYKGLFIRIDSIASSSLKYIRILENNPS